MAPYGACGVVQSTGRSSEVPPNVRWASQNWAHSIRMFGWKWSSDFEEKISMLEAAQWLRRKYNHARAVTWAHSMRICGSKQHNGFEEKISILEQWFRVRNANVLCFCMLLSSKYAKVSCVCMLCRGSMLKYFVFACFVDATCSSIMLLQALSTQHAEV